MKKISTPYMFSIKALSFIFVGSCAFVLALMLLNGVYERSPRLLFVPCVMAIIGYLFAKMNNQGLVDEVYDCGNHLLVQKHGEEDRIPLANIMNVNFNVKPARITLTLATPGKFGTQISFAPPPQVYISPVPENEIAQDLLARTVTARSNPRSLTFDQTAL